MNKPKEPTTPPQEIPTKQYPHNPTPAKDPNLEPDETNPINPKEDEN